VPLVTKQYNLVPAKGRWCSAAGEVTAGLAESNGSLPPGGWLTVTCRLTASTLGSAPGPTLDIEYGKPLPLPFTLCCVMKVTEGDRSHHGKGQFWGKEAPIVKCRDFLLGAVQKWPNWLICHLGCGLGFVEGSTRSVVFSCIRQVAPVCRTTLLWTVRKQLNWSICHLGCGLRLAQWSTSSIVFARWRQCAQVNHIHQVAPVCWTALCRVLCENDWADRFAVWVVDSGEPKEAQV